MLSAFLFLASTLHAQQPPRVHLLVHFTPPPTEQQEKLIFESLRGTDPLGAYHFDRASASLDLSSTSGIAANDYVEALRQVTGLQFDPVTDLENPASPEHALVDVPGFPKYVDTGDRTGDNLRYQEAKQAWIEAHPAAYETMRHDAAQ